MASHKNFSKKDRQRLDNDTFNNPQNLENRAVNKNQIKEFNNVKNKWRELCSYFRLNNNIIINI